MSSCRAWYSGFALLKRRNGSMKRGQVVDQGDVEGTMLFQRFRGYAENVREVHRRGGKRRG